MQSSRSPLFTLLVQEFADPAPAKQEANRKALATSLARLQKNSVSRIFDDFSVLLTPADFDEYASQFSDMLKRFKYRETDKGLKLIGHEAQEIVLRWVTKIAARGCRDLIDKKQINLELAGLLGWTEYVSKIDNCELLCAYVNAVNLMIFDKLNVLIMENEFIFKTVSGLINRQYTRCIIDVLDTMEIPYDMTRVHLEAIEQPAEEIQEEQRAAERPSTFKRDVAIAAGVGFAGLLFGAAAIAGTILLGRSNSSDSLSESCENPDYTPPQSPRW